MPSLHTKVSLILNFLLVVMQNKHDYYEDNASGIDGANGRADHDAEHNRIVYASIEVQLFGKISCDFLSCDNHLISGVTIRLSVRRSLNDVVLMSDN